VQCTRLAAGRKEVVVRRRRSRDDGDVRIWSWKLVGALEVVDLDLRWSLRWTSRWKFPRPDRRQQLVYFVLRENFPHPLPYWATTNSRNALADLALRITL